MTRLVEGKHAGAYIVSEAEGNRSRELITLPASFGDLEVGDVLSDQANVITLYADGSPVVGVVFENSKDSTSPRQIVIHARDCEVDGSEISFGATVDANPTKLATAIGKMEEKGIIVR